MPKGSVGTPLKEGSLVQRGVRNRTWLLSRVAVTTGRMLATVEGDADVVNSEGVH